MKPSNEIEIKRNVYTFSGIVLVLSVLIGSSAWTLSRKGVSGLEEQKKTAQMVVGNLQANTTKLHLGVAESSRAIEALKEKVRRLEANAQRNALRSDVLAVIEYMKSADAKAGQNGRATFLRTEPQWQEKDSVDSDATELYYKFNAFYGQIADVMDNKEKEVDRLEKKLEVKCPGQGSTADCTDEVNTVREQAAAEINDLKRRLAAIDKRRIEGLQVLTKERTFSSGFLENATAESLKKALDEQANGSRSKCEAVWREYINLLVTVKGKTQGIQ